MYIVKDSQAAVPYQVTPGIVVDAKGDPIPNEKVAVAIVSDNPAVVTLTPDQVDLTGLTGIATFGTPGTANVNVTITDAASGTVLGSFGAQFTVTAGDPTSITGGTIAFTGLTNQ